MRQRQINFADLPAAVDARRVTVTRKPIHAEHRLAFSPLPWPWPWLCMPAQSVLHPGAAGA